MSGALGLAATAATLQHLLVAGFAALKLDDVLGETPDVTCIPPDRVKLDSTTSQVNLFLYNQTRNTGWCNQGLPSRDGRGERVASPALALDLHFLVTAHGAADFHGEVLLGAAMQILHETPVLGREAIREALKPVPQSLPKLNLAGLADQVEQLKITSLNHTTDEVSRIWSAIQVPGRPSAAYLVSVLLIEGQKSSRMPLPVSARNLYVVPLRAPRLDRAEASEGPLALILPTSKLVVSGANLKAPQTSLRVNGLDFSAGIAKLENDRLELGFLSPPAPALPEGLRAGVCTLQLSHAQVMGTPPAAHGGAESNVLAFVLNPLATFSVAPGATSTVVAGLTHRSGKIVVTCSPAIGARQRVRLLLNEKDPPATRPARAYTFAADDGNGILPPDDATDTVTIAYQSVVQGRYLARVQVDAGISPLELAEDGRFSGPEVLP
jgi:uncharacterized protein DUF4255